MRLEEEEDEEGEKSIDERGGEMRGRGGEI